MRRILSIAMGSLLATAVVLAVSVAASASNPVIQGYQPGLSNPVIQGYRAGLIAETSEQMPDPDRCGPSGVASLVTYTGRDTLGGAFEMSFSICFVGTDQPDTFRIFDQQGTGRYILTAEEWTIHAEDYLKTHSPFPTCVSVPEKPIKFTMGDFTGEHAGGQVIGRADFITSTFLCGGLPADPTLILWFVGVFTSKGCGLGFELALLLPGVMWLYRRRRLH